MNTIRKKSTTQLTLENLQQYILDDTVEVGDRFPTEKDLCSMLGVGRGTVREAVKVLVSQDILEIRPGLGTFVKNKVREPDPISSWFCSHEVELQDLTVIRAVLEPLAVKLAIDRCTDEQLDDLKEIHRRSEAAAQVNDAAALAQTDEEFHRTIFLLSGNALLVEISSMITSQLAQFRQNTFKIKSNVDNFIPAHYEIIKAFDQHDPALGEKKMKQHMKKVAEDLETSKYN